MRVGFYSPLPPARTGVADYSAALLAALRKHGPVDVASPHADVFLYHIGNNQIHQHIYQQALSRPGVVVLHDAVLHHFFLGSLDESSYVEEFVYNYGEWNRGLASELWLGRASSALDLRYYRYPMLRRIAEVSRAVVVHNPAAAKIVRQHSPATPVVEIPHLFQSPGMPSDADLLRFRDACRLPSSFFVFGVFGYLRESKRLVTILRSFDRVRSVRANTALLIAGKFVSSDLARAAAPLITRRGVARIGYLSDSQFCPAAWATDACINLRYPAAGETSGICVRMMGIGKPVMVTAGEETCQYPELSCIRVDPGLAEEAMLAQYMLWIASFPEAGLEIGRRGAEHIAEHHALDRVAEQYWKTLCAYRS